MLRRFSKMADKSLCGNNRTRGPTGNQATIETETTATTAEE